MYLIAGIIAAVVFIGFIGETEPKTILGFTINVWFFKMAWLLLAISFLNNYYKLMKEERNIS